MFFGLRFQISHVTDYLLNEICPESQLPDYSFIYLFFQNDYFNHPLLRITGL